MSKPHFENTQYSEPVFNNNQLTILPFDESRIDFKSFKEFDNDWGTNSKSSRAKIIASIFEDQVINKLSAKHVGSTKLSNDFYKEPSFTIIDTTINLGENKENYYFRIPSPQHSAYSKLNDFILVFAAPTSDIMSVRVDARPTHYLDVTVKFMVYDIKNEKIVIMDKDVGMYSWKIIGRSKSDWLKCFNEIYKEVSFDLNKLQSKRTF